MIPRLLIGALLIIIGIGGGVLWIGYPQIQSYLAGSPSKPKVLLSETASLNYTSQIQNPYNPTHTETWRLALNAGESIRVTIHTDNTVYFYVKIMGCFGYTPAEIARCTVVGVGLTVSENPPNVTEFVAPQDATYYFSISLFQDGSLLPAPFGIAPANVQIIVEALP